MDGLLSVIENSGFSETLEEVGVFEATALAIKRGYIKKKHKVIRQRPGHTGHGLHTRSEHRSHGHGSFCRTHSHPTCRR